MENASENYQTFETEKMPHSSWKSASTTDQSSREEILAAQESCPENGLTTLQCKNRHSSLSFVPMYILGDPRNQAILIHEDGWGAHSTSSEHSTAAITVIHGCMNKLNRCDGANAKVYSFVPANQLPACNLIELVSEFMSSEESDSSDYVIVVKPLVWRAEKVAHFFHHLD